IAVAKRTNLPVVLVGHVTKDGAIAGPRVLEHLVDVVCQFEGDKHAQLRLVRAVKNRFGSVDEVGCFTLDERGIHGLPDPSGLFLSGGREPVAGSCVTVTLDGRRPMPIEVQALLARTTAPQPRRATHGLDSSRVAMTLAVLSARLGLDASGFDTYVSTVGGSRAPEPAVDLAVALAVVSARRDEPLAEGLVAVGEIGLAGELRPVVGTGRRLAEARRLGCTRAIVPARSELVGGPPAGMSVTQAADPRSAAGAEGRLAGGAGAAGGSGLAGGPAPVVGPGRRLAAARRLGFARAIVRARSGLVGGPPAGMSVTQAADLRSAVGAAIAPASA